MDLQEHLNENPRLKVWYEAVEYEENRLASCGYHLVCGWPAEEYNLGWDDYISWCHEQLDEVEEGDDVQPFPTYIAWRDERMPEDENLGFSWDECELCGAQAGDRYAASAINTEKNDCVIYDVCGSCLQYIANGELPEDM